MTIETGWDSGNSNMWQVLQDSRKWVWVLAVVGGFFGVCWAWIILLPIRNVQSQLEAIADQGPQGRLELDHQSELSFLANAFNRALEQVEKSLPRRAQLILGSVTSGVVVIDSGGRVEWMNPHATRLFHVPLGNYEGQPFKEVLGRSSDLVSHLSLAFRDQVDLPRKQVKLTDKYGESREMSAWMVWVQDEENAPLGMVLTVMDNNRLESFASGIEGAEKASSLRHMASGIVHEIRNPLTPIRGLAQIMSGDKQVPADKLKSYSKVIVDAVDRVNQVIDRFAMLTKPPEEDFAVTPLEEILKTVRESTSHLAKKAKVAVEFQVEDPALEVACQPKLLARALINILINGIEASPSKGVVTVTAKQKEDKVIFEVENLGSSIPPGEMEDLFLPFHTTKKNGTGLGLPISDSIVRSHRGEIFVRSGANRTAFSVQIPLELEGRESPRPADRARTAAGVALLG
ncbi:MAG: HAMP domain-containing protein [Candidatus Omnitrophica bacterium]|nr:HAMP domain-containing protein [Candidatus Omnitrophota bacterium]